MRLLARFRRFLHLLANFHRGHRAITNRFGDHLIIGCDCGRVW